jgi:hypothetical protein
MAPKLKNRSLGPEEVQAARAADNIPALQPGESARLATKAALRQWYVLGYNNANASIPDMQKTFNLRKVGNIPGWQALKGSRNGYVMLTNFLSGTLKPMILELDYDNEPPLGFHSGGLTYFQLHQQIRETLKLEIKVSLQMCPFRPWHRHIRNRSLVYLPDTEVQCRHLLGTTLLYFVEREDSDSESALE